MSVDPLNPSVVSSKLITGITHPCSLLQLLLVVNFSNQVVATQSWFFTSKALTYTYTPPITHKVSSTNTCTWRKGCALYGLRRRWLGYITTSPLAAEASKVEGPAEICWRFLPLLKFDCYISSRDSKECPMMRIRVYSITNTKL